MPGNDLHDLVDSGPNRTRGEARSVGQDAEDQLPPGVGEDVSAQGVYMRNGSRLRENPTLQHLKAVFQGAVFLSRAGQSIPENAGVGGISHELQDPDDCPGRDQILGGDPRSIPEDEVQGIDAYIPGEEIPFHPEAFGPAALLTEFLPKGSDQLFSHPVLTRLQNPLGDLGQAGGGDARQPFRLGAFLSRGAMPGSHVFTFVPGDADSPIDLNASPLKGMEQGLGG